MAIAPSLSDRNTLPGITLAAIAFALLTSMDTVFKLVAADGHPAYQILLVNGCFTLIPIVGWAMMTGGIRRLYTVRIAQHFTRGAVSVTSSFAAIYAYSRLPLTDFYAIVFAGPLIITTLSAFWLGEKVEPSRWVAIGAGFIGILVVANPFGTHTEAHNDAFMLGRFAAYISVFCYSLSIVMIRHMRLSESNLSFSFYGYLSAVIIGTVVLLLRGAPPLTLDDIAHLALSGMLSAVSSICLMTAYHRTPVALVAPFQYTQIVWGAIAGYMLWAQIPGARLIAGACIVAASGMFVIYREFGAKQAS